MYLVRINTVHCVISPAGGDEAATAQLLQVVVQLNLLQVVVELNLLQVVVQNTFLQDSEISNLLHSTCLHIQPYSAELTIAIIIMNVQVTIFALCTIFRAAALSLYNHHTPISIKG